METHQFIVTEAAMRPACDESKCFYCRTAVGSAHKNDCVLIKKKVKVRMTVEYEVYVPASWDSHDIEFHRNDGSWCSGNAIDELAEAFADQDGCMCNATTFTHLGDCGIPVLKEV